jgi:predicted SAM-dependent methyltransferase
MSWTKEELLEQIKMRPSVIIELGCGPNPPQNIIGIDHINLPGVHFVTDLEQGLGMIPNNSIDEVHSSHFMEHIQNFEGLIKDIHRILKPEGKNIVVVPHFANPHYYSDYTHKRFFGLYTFDYFSRPENQLARKVPAFYTDVKFKVVKRKFVFKTPEFPILNFFNRWILQPVFNANAFMQELYEGTFCWIFPCRELVFEMIPEK